MSKSLNEWGRFLALVLRHKPQAVGIELDAHGWAQVEALLVAFNRIEAFTMLMLEQIVAEDGKQRFAFSEDKKRIRANQGHSVKVDVELREAVPPELLYTRCWQARWQERATSFTFRPTVCGLRKACPRSFYANGRSFR